MAINDPEFMTVKEVAVMCRVTTTSVYRWIEQGELRALRIGGVYRVPAAALRELLAGSRVVTITS